MIDSQHLKSIQRVSNSYLCSNCGACQVICPKEAIDFKTSTIGRIYAVVTDKCVDCGLCQKVCPSLTDAVVSKSDGSNLLGNIYSLRVGKALDNEIYLNSQSGGICTAVIKYLFDTNKIDGALVCRMNYGYNVPKVETVLITDVSELRYTQKSCYTAVQLLGCLRDKIKEFASLAVVGLGCHLEGLTELEKYSKDLKGKIYCKLGLICDRSLCGTIQDVYSSFLKGNKPKKIIWRCKHASFLNPKDQYKSAPLVIENIDGSREILPNLYRFALKDMFTSPRCRICRDKLNLCADLTLGDPWKMSNIDWEKGESVVIGRTKKGENIISEAITKGYILLTSRPLEELIKGQLVEERKHQVECYSSAFSILKPEIPSFLLNNSEKKTEVMSVKHAQRELEEFVELEKLSKEEIIKKAVKKIRQAEFKHSFFYRAIRMLYHIYKK